MSNCYSCKYRKNVPGDAHIQCGYPLLKSNDRITISMMAIAQPEAFNQVVKENFGFTADIGGLRSGYFCFPENFDPTWMFGECNKHSDLVGEQVTFHIRMEKSLLRHTVLKIGVQEGKIEETDQVKEATKLYDDAFTFIHSEETKSRRGEDGMKVRDEFGALLDIADTYFVETGLLEKIKAMPEFERQPI